MLRLLLALAMPFCLSVSADALAAPQIGRPAYSDAAPALRALAVDQAALQAALAEINRLRAQAGVGALVLNTQLTAAAQAHAEDMAVNGYFSHTSRDGRGPGQRIAATGYKASTWGENIAMGYASWQAAINAWMTSAGHRANMLRASFKEIGLGIQNRRYVQDFATPSDRPVPPPPCPVP